MVDKQVIIVGGGLAGLSAAHTVIERGGRVLVLDKNPFMGGNSTKATSGINGALTKTQIQKGIPDSVFQFEQDTAISAAGGVQGAPSTPLIKVLTHQSGSAVDWLQERFGLDLSLVSRLGGHSFPRTHRGKERFPGMTITMALMEKLESLQKSSNLARIITKAQVTKLLKGSDGNVIGVEYTKDNQVFQEYGPVIIATGGFAADFSENSLLTKYRPDLLHLPTTNGEHCTGDGIKVSTDIGAKTIDMEAVQVHPTGLVHPDEPDAKVKFLAAEALRGTGAILLDQNGRRFCNELGRRDYVTGEMWKNKGPFRLILNSAASKEIEWHCKHYTGRGLMKHFANGAELAAEIGIPVNQLEATFNQYNEDAKKGEDQYGKKFFDNVPFRIDDQFYVSIVCPVLHYCMGGLEITPESEVVGKNGVIPGLYAAGEVVGGIHGKNRLGGNSLLDCVVFGRVAGNAATQYLLQKIMTQIETGDVPTKRISTLGQQLGSDTKIEATVIHSDVQTRVSIDPHQKQFIMDIKWNEEGVQKQNSITQVFPQASKSPTVSPVSSVSSSTNKEQPRVPTNENVNTQSGQKKSLHFSRSCQT